MHKFKKIFIEIPYILLIFPVLFLLVNKYPYLLIGSLILAAITSVYFFVKNRSITSFHVEPLIILVIIYSYFIFSYFITGQSLKDFFSYQFLRNDGNFFFCYILFFVFSLSDLDYKKTAKYFFQFIFSVFSIFSIFGLVGYFTGLVDFLSHFESTMMYSVEQQGEKMFFALNNSHNATGSVYAVVCIALLVFFLREKSKKIKVLYGLLFLINLTTLFITKSRASYMGFVGAAIIIIWLHFQSIKKFIITIGIFFICSLPILYVTKIYTRLIQMINIKDGTTVIRFYIWEKAWELFSKSPIFGIGFGRFNDIFNIDNGTFDLKGLRGLVGTVALYMGRNLKFDTAHTHNSYLQFLTETGVIGFCLMMLFWILMLIKILQIYNYSTDEFSKKVTLSAIGSIFVLFILSFFEHYMSATTLMVPISILIPIALGIGWQNVNNPGYYIDKNSNIICANRVSSKNTV